MLARTNRNGLIIPHGADGLGWGALAKEGVLSNTTAWRLRATVSGLTICGLPICCQNGVGSTFNQLDSLSDSFNAVYDMNPSSAGEGLYCSWTINGTLGHPGFPAFTASMRQNGASCGIGTLATNTQGIIQAFYCRTTGHVVAVVRAVVGSLTTLSGGVLFAGTSSTPDPCWPLTIDNDLGAYDCGSCSSAGVTCNGTPYGDGQPVWGYGGSMTLELLCP